MRVEKRRVVAAGLFAVVSVAGYVLTQGEPALESRDLRHELLSTAVRETEPWLHIEGGSERMPPVYLGPTARELALGLRRSDRPEIPVALKALGEAHAEVLRQKLGLDSVELETWPVAHWRGHWTWAFPRFRESAEAPWRWIPSHIARREDFTAPFPELPAHYLPWKRVDDENVVFRDFLEWPGLYDKPRFGDCVWTDASGGEVLAAWVPSDQSERWRRPFLDRRLHAHVIPQPARWNEKPIAFVLPATAGKVRWPEAIRWIDDTPVVTTALPAAPVVTAWPADFTAAYRADVETLSGPRFPRKSTAQRDHQLVELADFLRDRYTALGIRSERQDFRWRGIAQANVVAKIPGRLTGRDNRPILLADHIDTAFEEDVYEATGERRSSPGADDDVSATATLLRAAGIAKALAARGALAHDLWLVHFTGEEMPADCLGARQFVTKLFHEKQDIGGLVVLDMIGFRQRGDRVFQLHPGGTELSQRMARIALAAAKDVAPELEAVVRPRKDPRSWLYNTDGILFSDVGYPVLLFNEHLNVQRIRHPHYHQSSDTAAHLDYEYATGIAKTAIETALRLAREEPSKTLTQSSRRGD